MEARDKTYTAFAGHGLIGQGQLAQVALRAKALLDQGEMARIAIYDDETGEVIDIDYRGTPDDVVARLASHPMVVPPAAPPRPGRPKLGVVSREVSLLPGHWQWLAEQPGGASACLRKLVHGAMRQWRETEALRKAMDALGRFMWDMAGSLPGFEEANRRFYAKDWDGLADIVARWPADVSGYALARLAALRQLERAAAGPEEAKACN